MFLLIALLMPGIVCATEDSSKPWTGPAKCGPHAVPFAVADKGIRVVTMGAHGRTMDGLGMVPVGLDMIDGFEVMEEACMLEFESFEANGNSLFSWSLEGDFTIQSWRETGVAIPGTLVFYGDPLWDEKRKDALQPVLAVQDVCLDTTRPFNLTGTISLAGSFSELSNETYVELFYGINSEDFLRLVGAIPTQQVRLHYAEGSDGWIERKEFAKISEKQYRYYFKVIVPEPITGDYDYDYEVVLFNEDGWAVGAKKGDRILRYGVVEQIEEVMGEIAVKGEPKYMRVFISRHYRD